MLNQAAREVIMDWHIKSGGHNGRPASHALRMLREMVELCVASGANCHEILGAVTTECNKARVNGEFRLGPIPHLMAEECADVTMLLSILIDYNQINLMDAFIKKMKVLRTRQWEADQDGVLWRPGTK